MKVSTALRPSSASHSELLLRGLHRGAALLQAHASLGELGASAIRPASIVLESSTSAAASGRVAGDLVEVQADAVAALDLACRRVQYVLPWDAPPLLGGRRRAPHTCCTTSTVTIGFPRQTFGPVTRNDVRGAHRVASRAELSESSQGRRRSSAQGGAPPTHPVQHPRGVNAQSWDLYRPGRPRARPPSRCAAGSRDADGGGAQARDPLGGLDVEHRVSLREVSARIGGWSSAATLSYGAYDDI